MSKMFYLVASMMYNRIKISVRLYVLNRINNDVVHYLFDYRTVPECLKIAIVSIRMINGTSDLSSDLSLFVLLEIVYFSSGLFPHAGSYY